MSEIAWLFRPQPPTPPPHPSPILLTLRAVLAFQLSTPKAPAEKQALIPPPTGEKELLAHALSQVTKTEGYSGCTK